MLNSKWEKKSSKYVAEVAGRDSMSGLRHQQEALASYIQGVRKQGFRYEQIWDVIGQIPRGRVATYGAVGEMCGLASQPRLVGYALHNLPPGIEVPWHRVVNARGGISLRGESGRLQLQLLESEGVVFVRGRIDLSVYGWKKRSPRLKTLR